MSFLGIGVKKCVDFLSIGLVEYDLHWGKGIRLESLYMFAVPITGPTREMQRVCVANERNIALV